VVIGGGGHAKVVIDAMRLQGRYKPVAVTDSDDLRKQDSVLGVPIVGNDNELKKLYSQGIKHFIVGLGSRRNNLTRKDLFDLARGYGFMPAMVVHPNALLATSATVGLGSLVLAGAIINPDARIGENVIINTGAIVEHDCVVGNHVHLCPGVRLSGSVEVGEGSLVSAGALVRQNLQIGDWVVIGMGAVVVKSVAPRSTVAGVPARRLRSERSR